MHAMTSRTSFTAAASGYPSPTVQWKVSTNGGSTFTPTCTPPLACAAGAWSLTLGSPLQVLRTNSGGTAAEWATGVTGPTGPTGYTGPAGAAASTGSTGYTGPQGPTGYTGAAGIGVPIIPANTALANVSGGATGPYAVGPTDLRTMQGLGTADVPSFAGVKVSGTQVLSTQQGAIANTSQTVSGGGNTIDMGTLQAFVGITNSKINTILAALRAHGLIAP